MNKLNTKINEAVVKGQNMLISSGITPQKVQKHARIARIGLMALTVISMLAMMCVPALAANMTDVQGLVTGGVEQVWNTIRAVATGIALVAIGVAAFQFFTGGEKGAEKAKKLVIYAIIGLAVIYLAPFLLNVIRGTFFGSHGTESVDWGM